MDIDFNKLICLQNIDTEIIEISHFLDNIPSQTKKIDEEIDTFFQTVSQAKEKLRINQKNRREIDSEIQNLTVLISKYKHQLNGVKSNKEYSSLIKEIEETKKKIDSMEEEEISKMLAADDIVEEIRKASLKAEQEKEKLLKKKKVLFQKKIEIEEKKKNLLHEEDLLIHKLPSQQIKLYQKIFIKKNHIVLSPVKDDFCSICQIRIRPQVLNELKAKNSIILCENCGRILYWLKKPA